MTKNDIPYEKISHSILYNLLKDNDISTALAYMVVGELHANFQVIPHKYSIELSNGSITISVVLFVGFESNEYETLRKRNNYHIVSFNNMTPKMLEFKGLNIKYIDNNALLSYVISFSNTDFGKKLRSLLKLEN